MGYPRCFLTRQAIDTEGGMEVHHQGPTLENKQGKQVGVSLATPILLWSWGLITTGAKSGDRHQDEKALGRAPTVLLMLSL